MPCLLVVPLLRGSFATNIIAPLTQIAMRCLRLGLDTRRVNRARRCLCLSSPVCPCSGSVRRGSISIAQRPSGVMPPRDRKWRAAPPRASGVQVDCPPSRNSTPARMIFCMFACECICACLRPLAQVSGKSRRVRSDKGQRHARREATLQVSCVAWADANNILVDGSPGGAAFKHGAHHARGCNRAGRPDLLVLEAGGDGSPGLAVELKTGGNDLSEAQRDYFKRLESRGWRVGVARDLSEFVQLVQGHLHLAASTSVVNSDVCLPSSLVASESEELPSNLVDSDIGREENPILLE